MASSVDAIHGSGPVLRRPSMDRRACGFLNHLLKQWPTVLELQAVLVPLEQSLSVPPRGWISRFGRAFCAAVVLEHQHEKFRPHGYRFRFGDVAMRAVINEPQRLCHKVR